MELTLSEDSPTNTILTDSNDFPVYTIATPFKLFQSTTSTITSADGSKLAEIEWRSFGTAILRYRDFDGDIRDYLRPHTLFNLQYTFTASDGREYRWIIDPMLLGALRLQLEDGSKALIARTNRANHFGLFSRKRKASIEIYPEGQPITNDIAVTFVYVDKMRRSKQQSLVT